jgi:hypothetical protein
MHKQIIRREFSSASADLFTEIHPLLRRIYAARQVSSTRVRA